MQTALRTIGWLACVIYSTIPAFWLIIHTRADRLRSRARSPYRLLLPLWITLWIAVALMTLPWRHLLLYQSPWTWPAAVALFATGIWLYRKSGANFTFQQLIGVPELHAAHSRQQLVTTGIRARIRHPVYLAHLCEMLAWSLATGLAVCYGLAAFTVITGALMIRAEDTELEQRFGKPFNDYRNSVPALIPKLLQPRARL